MPSRIGKTADTKLTSTTTRLAMVPPQPLPATSLECLEEAYIAVKLGKFKRAETLLRKADEQPLADTDMWQGWTNLGQACYEASESRQVEEAFLQALKYDPDELASHFNLALGYHLNEKYQLTLAAHLTANQIEPKH